MKLFKRNKIKKVLKEVVVILKDHREEELTEHIIIPNGCKFKLCSYSSDCKIIDENGYVIRTYDWKLGYTIQINYIY